MPHPFFSDRDNVAERRKALRQTTELGPDEIVLWSGRPKRGIVFSAADAFTLPLGMVFAVFAFHAVISIPNKPIENATLLLHRLIFLFGAFYITIGRFIADALYRSRLRYVVTNQRIMIVNGLCKGSVTSVDRSALKLQLVERSDDRGTVHLLGGGMWDDMGRPPLHACAFRRPHLFRIKDARRVYELLRPSTPAH